MQIIYKLLWPFLTLFLVNFKNCFPPFVNFLPKLCGQIKYTIENTILLRGSLQEQKDWN
jgi:hypothetical protein